MRSAIAVAAFAAGVLAVPYKRDVVTNYDVVYVTNVVTVTSGQAQPYSTPSHDQPAHYGQHDEPAHYGHHHHQSYSTSTTVQKAPATTSTSTYEAPLTTYAPAPTYKAPTTIPAPSSSSAAAGAAPTSYQEIVVFSHNLHRANHSSEDLEWSDDLYSSAQEIAASCVYAHNTDVQGGGYGQNIAAGVEPSNVSAIITDLFYNGEEPYYSNLYGQANPDMSNFELWGHFSQIVWKGTTHVACATQHCPGGLANVGSDVAPYFTVCNYKNPGNYAGEYADNVLAPLGKATANWNTGLSQS